MDPERSKDRRIYRARGCENCFHTGYKGRNAIFEIMVLNEELRSLLLKSYDSNVIKKRALEMNMLSLRQDGIQKLLNGVTTIEEVFRVTMK
jgi:general secretion pathway protein E